MKIALGIDVGGSGIKGAPVDVTTGQMISERFRIPTPQPSVPNAVADVILKIKNEFKTAGPIGCTFPGVIQNNIVYTATNFDTAWEGLNVDDLLNAKLNSPVVVINDADAAGIAEMQFGAGVKFQNKGVVLMLTFGTGIGSAIFVKGQLLPNTELGCLELDGETAETRAAARLREDKLIGWKKWIKRVQRYLSHVESLFWPDLIIFGGGISHRSERFLDELKTRTKLVPAKLLNNAGIVGAAMAAQQKSL